MKICLHKENNNTKNDIILLSIVIGLFILSIMTIAFYQNKINVKEVSQFCSEMNMSYSWFNDSYYCNINGKDFNYTAHIIKFDGKYKITYP